LFDVFCGDEVAVWGVTEGKKGQNKTKWKRLQTGDIALLYKKKKIFNKSRISLCIHNEDLAKNLWKTNSEGKTWEYIYFLDQLQDIDLSIEHFNEAIGYKPNYIIQGFNVLEEEKANVIAELLGETGRSIDITEENTSFKEIQAKIDALEITDLPSSTKARQESQLFRKYLFGKSKQSICDICGRSLPSHLLVAAHIKPRSDCTEQEKRDLNVVFRACKLGCDELFEKSYLIVDDRGVIVGTDNLKKSTQSLRDYAANLIDKKCVAFNENNQQYFLWRSHHQKRFLT
jgi:hypothetical protein